MSNSEDIILAIFVILTVWLVGMVVAGILTIAGVV